MPRNSLLYHLSCLIGLSPLPPSVLLEFLHLLVTNDFFLSKTDFSDTFRGSKFISHQGGFFVCSVRSPMNGRKFLCFVGLNKKG